MSYASNEAARTGRAFHLFTFTRATPAGIGLVWRYVAADGDVTVDGVTFRAAVLTHEQIRRGEGGPRAALRLRAPADLPLVTAWRSASTGAPDAPTLLTIQRAYATSAGAVTAGDDATIWRGTVDAVEREDAEATLTCYPLLAALQRPVPRPTLQRQCNHALYDHRCGVVPSTVARTGTVTALEQDVLGGAALGPTVTVTLDDATLPEIDGETDWSYFDGGLFVWTPTTGPDAGRELARVHVVRGALLLFPTVVFSLLRAIPGLAEGDTVTAYPGCQGQHRLCVARFANGRRFGGFPQLPERDVFAEGVG